ncbi:MAG: alpha/beta fold hydrolase [Acidimicrobiia bacterium]|nr:alpha/beta fold hydrolase [Acidimicrobiia bacterium]
MTAIANQTTPRLILAHGFTQTARSWERVARCLAEVMPGSTTTAVDLPDHGDAPSAVSGSDLWRSADHLVECGGQGVYVGYSMGGRVTLHAALAQPELVSAMVLIGATAGIDSDSERVERRAADELLADRIEQIGVADFVEEWLRNPLFAGLTPETAQVEDRCRNTAAGLATSLRCTGTGTQEPLWSRLPSIAVPTLILAGEHDAKFRTLGHRLTSSIPDSTLLVIPDAGHTTHLEQPRTTTDAIASWLLSR